MSKRHSTCLCSLAILLATGSLVCSSAWAADANALPAKATNWAAPGAGASYNAAGGTAAKPVGMVVLNNNATVLNWNHFNIGKDATLQFTMPSSTARVLNNVTGGALTPTQINGALNANGQVYIYDPRGIVFGKGSQVNVNSLVASSLRVDPDRFLNGILAPSADPIFALDSALGFMPGAVVVQGDANGSALERAAITAQQNGFILLAAPEVQNAGDLKAPDGQVLLASGSKVYLAAPSDNSMRGFKVEVSNDGLSLLAASAANASNTVGGVIDVQRGNATLVGMAVNQMGTVSATTSVNLNGSIYLKAQGGARKDYASAPLAVTESGAVVLGSTSRTEVLPTLSDTTTAGIAPNGPDFKPSVLDFRGKTIVLQGDGNAQGASVLAPGGQVALAAQSVPNSPAISPDLSAIRLEGGSSIDVSGSKVQMAMESNVFSAELRGAELADSPLLRNSALRGQKVYMDSRQALAAAGLNSANLTSLETAGSATLIADTSAYLKQLEQNVGQKTTAGGTVSLAADGLVSLQTGSAINVSGGWVDYQPGYINTTKLTLGGKLYDVQTAPADLPYDGLVRLPDSSQNLELGYRQGASAGTVTLGAPQLIIQAGLQGAMSAGLRQRDKSAADAPKGASLVVGTAAVGDKLALGQGVQLGSGLAPNGGLTIDVSALGRQGFDAFTVRTSAAIEVANALVLNPTAKLTLTSGADMHWRAGVSGAGASVRATAQGLIALDAGTVVDLAGRWQNDISPANPPRDPNGAVVAPVATKGGTLSFVADVLTVGQESEFNVSGGAWLNASGVLSAGKAGNISLGTTGLSEASGVQLASGLSLIAYGLQSGGSLTLTGRNVWIGSDAPDAGFDPNLDLMLAPTFFQQGGFGSYDVGAARNLTVGAASGLAPRSQNWLLGSDYAQRASGAMQGVADLTLKPLAGAAGPRAATSLSLRAGTTKLPNSDRGVLRLERDASIVADPGSSVTLEALQALEVEGSVRVPGGTIALLLRSDQSTTGPGDIAPKIWVGEKTQLDASGSDARLWVDGRGLTRGELTAGGNILLGQGGTTVAPSPAAGAIEIAPGAMLNVSGAFASERRVLDGSQISDVQNLVSDAGSIALSSDTALLMSGTLLGVAGNETARGGNLQISMALKGRAAPALTIGAGTASALWNRALTFGDTVNSLGYAALDGKGFVSTASFAAGGFARIALNSPQAIVLEPGLDLASTASVRLDTPVLGAGVGAANAPIQIRAPSVSLGVSAAANQEPRSSSGAANDAKRELTVSADTLDLVGNSVTQGFSQVRLLASKDVRLQGVVSKTTATGSFASGGSLEIQAARVYPTTLSDFALRSTGAGKLLEIGTTGALVPSGEVLSAGGSLTLEADTIVQNGRLLAPFGQLTLQAANAIEYKAGSLTSVAGQGTVLFDLAGFTAGSQPNADLGERSLPVKKLSSIAPSVTQAAGAVLDASGGGTLYSYGVSLGPGGSKDILDIKKVPGTFAINPKFRGLTAPVDANAGSAGLQVGDQIYLSATAALPAGYYTLLPAHYALLDGGMAVVATGVSASPKDNRLNADGTYTVAGARSSSTDGRGDTRTTAFKLLTGTEVRRRTEFQDFNADTFFTAQAATLGVRTPDLPRDAGQLSFQVSTQLKLAGQTQLQGSSAVGNSGRAGMVDISAPAITVTADTSTEASGTVRLLAKQLNDLGADSLLLGGRRSLTADGMQVQVDASSVRIDNSRAQPLQGLELLLVARDSVEVTGRSSLAAQNMVDAGGGAVAQTAADLRLTGTGAQADGALLRLSSAGAVNIGRDTPLGTTGRLTVGKGAMLSGSGSIWLDATQDMNFQPSLNLAAGSSFAARSRGINLGAVDTPDTTAGLTLGTATLAKLNALSVLDLGSYSNITSYGNVTLGSSGMQTLRLQAGSFGSDGGNLALTAQSVALSGLAGASGTANASGGTGQFSVQADRLTLGEGALRVQGFANTNLLARNALVFGGSASALWVDNALSLQSPLMTASPGTVARVSSGGAMLLGTASGTPDATAGSGLGANLGFYALSQGLTVGTSLRAQGGQLAFSGATGVTVGAGALLDVSGVSMAFGSGMAYAPAGSILVDAGQGDLTLARAATLDLSSVGADAGRLELRATATGAAVVLAATLRAKAEAGVGSTAAENPLQASFSLDAGSAPANFDALNATLNDSGFTQSRSVRVRSGDLAVGAGSTLTARAIALSADDGKLTVAGTLDASGPSGGSIDLFAASAGSANTGKLALTGATLLADATQAATSAAGSLGDGGRVTLGVSNTGSTGGAALSLDAASRISTQGQGEGSGGEVRLRAPVNAAKTDVAVDAQAATVQTGALTLEAVQTYNVGATTLGASEVAAYKTDAGLFMANASAVQSRLALPALQVQPGVEVRSSGDLAVSVNEQASNFAQRGWNLSDWRFGSAQVPGTLTLRAAGDLTVRGSISDGFSPVDGAAMPQWALGSDNSWSMRLVGGGDLTAAAPLLTQAFSTATGVKGSFKLVFARSPFNGEVVDIPSALLRSGTGHIELAAAQNIALGSTVLRNIEGDTTLDQTFGASIYTAGRRIASLGGFAAPAGAAFGTAGGSIALRAGGDVVGVASGQTVNSWLFRQGRTTTDNLGQTVFAKDGAGSSLNTAWWARPDYLGAGVATLGGGDISVAALQGSVIDLTASTATNAYMPGSAPVASALVQQGGGDLLVRAGKDIAGGQFYVQKGILSMLATTSVKAGNVSLDRSETRMRPVLALGDASALVFAGGGADLETVYNPSLAPQNTANGTAADYSDARGATNQYSYFSTYGGQSSLNVLTLGGDANLRGNAADVFNASMSSLQIGSVSSGFVELLAVAPPRAALASMSGDVVVSGSFPMFPAARGQLEIYAKQNVVMDGRLFMGDVDPRTLSRVENPSTLVGGQIDILLGPSGGLASHAKDGLHAGDTVPIRVVALQGNVVGSSSYEGMLYLPKRLEMRAGRDIIDLGYYVQHLSGFDVTSLVAGRNITSSINPIDRSRVQQKLGGPGLLILNAQQGSIDLGNSVGVVTRGNLDNAYLPEGGAAIEAVAGIALSATEMLRSPTQTEAQNAALFTRISKAYSDAVEAKQKDPTAVDPLVAFDAAIATQFSQPVIGTGSILSFGSQFKTEQGGSIDLWAPGGSVIAGLEVASATPASNGIFTVRGGAIRSLVGQDFVVNQGRVFSLGGGDITLVSQNGNIDAGKGAKTATSAPPPLLKTDANGNTELDIAGSISGSGIATLRTSDTQAPSNVVAFAPRGIFDAGDAGVRSTGKVQIEAAVVLNANNIAASGGVSGTVVVASAASVAPPSADTASAATQAATKQSSAPAAPSLALTVDVLGYGDVSATPGKEDAQDDGLDAEETDANGRKKRKTPKAP